MRPRRVPSSNFVFRLGGGTEDSDLWCERTESPDGPVVRSVWEPTPSEREAISLGSNIELTVWGTGTPPIAMGVTDEQPGR